MPDPTPGRNDPCSCGSGKKYKKCCGPKAPPPATPPPPPPKSKKFTPPPGMYESPIDQLGNSALDAIESGDYARAETLCARLLAEYPDQIDGHVRSAMLRQAQGRYAEAADHYARALDVVKAAPEGFDDAVIQEIEGMRQEALQKAAAQP